MYLKERSQSSGEWKMWILVFLAFIAGFLVKDSFPLENRGFLAFSPNDGTKLRSNPSSPLSPAVQIDANRTNDETENANQEEPPEIESVVNDNNDQDGVVCSGRSIAVRWLGGSCAPLVSAIIPTNKYRPQTLKQAIDSALNQTYPNMEVVVVESSMDKRYDALFDTYKNDTRLIVERATPIPNKYSGWSRNVAIKLSSGKYVAFLDSDDVWLDRKVEETLAFGLLIGNDGFISTDGYASQGCRSVPGKPFKVWETNTEKVKMKQMMEYHSGRYTNNIKKKWQCSGIDGKSMPITQNKEWLQKHNTIITSSVIMRRDVFDKSKGFPEEMRREQDWALWLALFNVIPRFSYLPNHLVIYDRCHGKEHV